MLELLRQHRTNDEIADRLGITLDGAKYHVSSILSKLGVGSREEAAAWTPEEARRWPPGRWAVVTLSAGIIAVAVAGLALLVVAMLLNEDDQDSQPTDFGPMVVIVGQDLRRLARGGTGPVNIDDDCVTMTRENGEAVMLIWRSDEVLWNASAREIMYTSTAEPDATPITLRNGDIISVGGAPREASSPGNPEWLATPQATCTREQFFVDLLEAES